MKKSVFIKAVELKMKNSRLVSRSSKPKQQSQKTVLSHENGIKEHYMFYWPITNDTSECTCTLTTFFCFLSFSNCVTNHENMRENENVCRLRHFSPLQAAIHLNEPQPENLPKSLFTLGLITQL